MICNHQNDYYFRNFEWFLAKFLLSLIFSVIIVMDFLQVNVRIIKKISGSSADKRSLHYVLLIKALKAITTLTFHHLYFVICLSSYAMVHISFYQGQCLHTYIYICVYMYICKYIIKFIIEINTVIKLAHKQRRRQRRVHSANASSFIHQRAQLCQ